MKRFFKTFLYHYHWRNLLARKASTALNLFAIMVTVLVFLVMNGMAIGLRESLQAAGRLDTLIVLTKGAQTAEVSRMPPEYFSILRYYPEIATRANGKPYFSQEAYTIKPLLPASGEGRRWMPIRGIDPANMDLYTGVLKVSGNTLQKDGEVLIGNLVKLKLGNLKVGDSIEIGRQTHRIAGFFSANGSAFESELWITRNDFKVDFNISYDSIAVIRFDNLKDRDEFLARANQDPRLKVDIKTEKEYFTSLDKSAETLQFIASIIAFILSVAAVFTGMNALYASVASRTREIGTLRAMGFSRNSILVGFIFEGLTVACLAGLVAVLLSLIFQHLPIAYLRSSFRILISGPLIFQGLMVAMAVGLIGSFVPARQAARMKILEALR